MDKQTDKQTDISDALKTNKKTKKVTHDTWHRMGDMWQATHGGGGMKILSKFQLPSSWFGMVWHGQCLEDSEQKYQRINESINYEGVYRTALATLGH